MVTAKNKSQVNILRPLGKFMRRFHMIIFIILIVGIVAASVLMINNALTNVATDDYTSSINAGSIDQATLERIQSLHTSAQPAPAPAMPAGRVNPFAE